MHWANFLHFYQPIDQQPDILEAVIVQSYRPLLQGFRARPRVRLTININGSLLELFDRYGYQDLIDTLRFLGKEGRVEFTATPKYHAILPFLSREEAARQIKAHNETCAFFLGNAYRPQGFFPTEMAWSEELIPLIVEFGFRWVILDEIACHRGEGTVDYAKLYRIHGTELLAFFRERRLSNLIMSAVVRSRESLLAALGDESGRSRYFLTAMDGETFGHHRPGLEKLLFGLMDAPEFEFIQISDLPRHYHNIREVQPISSTWASSRQDIERGIQFLSWRDPENEIHRSQAVFTELALQAVSSMDAGGSRYAEVRKKMDAALGSDHFWWASAKPWWSIEMIEAGAHRLLEVARSIPSLPPEVFAKARDHYEDIVSTAFDWQRSGRVRRMIHAQNESIRIPFKDRTLGRGGAEQGVFYAFMSMMKRLEQEAAARGEYEQAILWRDAQYKLEHKHDIYDFVNAIDLLRREIPHEEVERTIQEYKAQYRKIRGGQPEQRGA